MHKLTFLPVVLSFFCIQSGITQKHDYMWPLGYGPNISVSRFYYNFNTDTPQIITRADTFSNGQYSASYCDAKGNILLFSNGHKLFDKNGLILENGDKLNPTIEEWNADHMFSYPGGQTGFFLEKPDDSNIVYFISLDYGRHPAHLGYYAFVGKNLMVATIDLSANNGAGKVIEKNKILLTGTLMSPAACRHANGRDWWLLVSNADENEHYRILFGPEGFSAPDTQYIGTKPNPIPYEGGNKNNQISGNCFSPMGGYYVDANDKLGFSIFNFDRCNGLLFNERRVEYPPVSPSMPNEYRSYPGTGAVFSNNERFFYKTLTYKIFDFAPGTVPYLLQYDLEDVNLPTSVDTINGWPFNITLEQCLGAELAPDGRIYVVHSGLGYCTVQYPDRKGKECKFVHDKPFFDVVIGSAIPYMPNYRLGPLDGSPCDTLGLDNLPVANFRVDDSLGFFTRYFYDLSHHEPATWHWDFGDGHTSLEQSPLHSFDSAGVYQVCLTVSNQYGNDTYCRTLYLGVAPSGEIADDGAGILLMPNPFSTHVSVAVSSEGLRGATLRLYDQLGRQMLRYPLTLGVNEIGTARLPQGMYYYQIEVKGELLGSGKCVKQ